MILRSGLVVAVACLATVFLCSGFAQAADPVRVEVETDDPGRIVLAYTFGTYDSATVEIDGAAYRELRLPDEPVFLERGAPALPHVNRSVVVPDAAAMAVRVLEADYREIHLSIAPSKGNLSRSVDPAMVPYEFGSHYRRDGFYPGAVAQLHEPYILRDHRGAVVQINPFQYNAARRVLRVYSSVRVEIAATGPGEINVLERKRADRKTIPAFERIYRGHFVNHRASAADRSYDEMGDMLILCHDDWVDNMAPFVAHKASIGIDASVVAMSTVGNSTSAIQSYIQSVYDSSDLAFVLLVGDIAQIASPDVWANGEWGASDPSYSRLAGGDDYPDVLIGRFSASTAAHVDTQVQRSIEYESLPATEEDWFWKGTGIASDEGAGIGDEGQSDIQHQGEIRAWLIGAGYTQVDQFYDPGASDSQVASALNAGRGVVNYTGHGSASSWGTTGFNTSDVNALTNTGQLPFIVSVACNNGEFENYTSCFGEAWLRATHNGEPSGAAAIYASSVSQSWAPPMEGQDEINLLLTDPAEPLHSFGGLSFGGSLSMMDAYGSAGVEMFETWIVFGDPSLRVRGTPVPPTGMVVTPGTGLVAEGPAGGPVSQDSVVYTVTNFDETPIEFSATTNAPWLDVDGGSGTISPGESVQVTVGFNDGSCNMDHGRYAADIEFLNLSRHEGDAVREASLVIGAPALRDRWDLASDPGWTAEGRWEFGAPSGGGGWGMGNPDPVDGASGENVFGVVLTGDLAPSITGPHYLTMGPLDFTATDSVLLKFQRWLNTQSDPPMSATVEVSTDGMAWQPVWANVADVTDAEWTPVEYDLSAAVAGSSSAQVRWGYAINASGAVFCSGWNLDDVEVWTSTSSVRTWLTVDDGQLSWTPAGGATGYDVVQGDLLALRASGGDFTTATLGCVENDDTDLAATVAGTPAPGEGTWFLVRGVAPSGAQTYQSLGGSPESLRDTEIAAAASSCP